MNRIDRQTSQFALAEQENYKAYNVPLLRDEVEIERPVDQRTITRRYTEEAVKRIHELKDGPFFLYLAHSLPHIPLFRGAEFKGHSPAGGDVFLPRGGTLCGASGALQDSLHHLQLICPAAPCETRSTPALPS